MEAYIPRDPVHVALLAGVVLFEVLIGLPLARAVPRKNARWIAWTIVIVGVAFVERVFTHEPAGLRMLAFIASAIVGLKAVVLIEDDALGPEKLPFKRWIAFAVGWPGLRPRVFAERARGALPGVGHLANMGATYAVVGAALWVASRVLWSRNHELVSTTAVFFIGSSLLVHFGVFDLLAAIWRAAGFACDELFRAPWLSQNLAEFWGRRWNLAFTEMTTLAIYRPAARSLGRNGAMLLVFLVSGLLHEMAISLPVRAGFGLPTAYFMLHGGLVWFERKRATAGRPIGGMLGRVWTLFWLVAPLPILFHGAFVTGVVEPLFLKH